jgi:TonB-dependent receptor
MVPRRAFLPTPLHTQPVSTSTMHAKHQPTPHPPGCVRLLAGLAAWLFLTLGLAAQSADTGTINGRVTDAISKSVLPGAEISVTGSDTRTATGKDGEFTLKLPAGTYDVTVSYLGQPSKTISATVAAGAATTLPVVLGDDVVELEAFKVEGTREGQARAINQQRASQNLVSIISSDLSGQFPDKTIADAVKRLPGVTVETDTDTGGSEGRYITIRGMNADFNAVSVNGMRVAVSDFSGLSRRVPLDVVSAKSADQIEVTKALRPDQDGDGIGGNVNIVTRSPFDRDGVYAFAEGAVGYSALIGDYTSNYPYDNPNYEASAGVSTQFGSKNQFGISVSTNFRDRAFVKQRVGVTGWAADGGPGNPYYPVSAAVQDFFDDVTATGFNTTLEWRPSDAQKLRLDVSYSNRDTERGRQRIQYGFIDGGAGTVSDDTYSTYTRTNRLQRNIRQFYEEQQIINAVLGGESTFNDDWSANYFVGANQGTFDGDPDRDISAVFRTAANATNTYTADGYLPTLTSNRNVNDGSLFTLNSLDRGTSFVTDDELAGGLDLKRKINLFGGDGFIKFGGKGRFFDRDYDARVKRYLPTGDWNLNTYTGAPLTGGTVGSPFANYGTDNGSIGGRYSYAFLDPNTVRDYANLLDANGRLTQFPDNAERTRLQSYTAKEDVLATYLSAQQTWDKFTVLTGARVELTRVNFTGNNGRTFVNNADPGLAFIPVPGGLSYFGQGYRQGDINPQTVEAYDKSNDYVNVLPGLHLRYDQTKNLLYRFAVTRSIARPRLSDINPSTLINERGEEAFSGGDSRIATIDKGNIDLKSTTSTNFDLGLEYYFGQASTFTFGLFYKDMKDNVYRGFDFNDPSFPSAPPQRNLVRTSLNAKSAWVRGFEVGYDQQLVFLPAPLDGLGMFANYTFADSEVDTGVPQYANTTLPLFNQVKHTINAGLFYEKSGFRARASVLYRSESLLGLAIDEDFRDYDPNLSRYQAPSTTLDLTASYRLTKNWQVFTEFQNVLDTPGRAYNGNKSRLDYNEVTDWSASVGLRWSL